jgi:heat shock protein HtpX
MNAWKLRLSMAGTLAIIIGLSTLVITAVLFLVGYFSLITIGLLVVVINVAQWLFAPYLIGWMYKARELKQTENPELHQTVESLSKKSGISAPRLMLAQIPIPNAFAYGSPISGTRVAVTAGLLKSLDPGEIEAVLGHELGHLKHRDVQAMMLVSFLPSLFFYIGYSLMLSGSGIFGGGSNNKNSGGYNALIGLAFMAFSWVLTLFTLYLSRLREYYADRHSASIVENGAMKLSTGLVTIVEESRRNMKPRKNGQKGNTSFRALFITDPDHATADSADLHANGIDKQALLRETLAQRPSKTDKFVEVFSTHPNIVKRLHALQELDQQQNSA